jgi:hypothetical protein
MRFIAINKKTMAKGVKRTTFSRKKALAAVKAAKKAYAGRVGNRPRAWKKGGREWSRVLGHFGTSSSGSSDK